jgi:hypothetical protein
VPFFLLVAKVSGYYKRNAYGLTNRILGDNLSIIDHYVMD